MSGIETPYRKVAVDLAGLPPGQRLQAGADDGGLTVELFHDGAPVGLELIARKDLPPEGLDPLSLLGPEARTAIAADRLRRRMAMPADRALSFSVAICSKDRPDWVARLLDSLLPQLDEAPFEVLVVDNAPSDDATRLAVAARPPVRYVREPLAGLDFARNRALNEARGDVVAYLDDDVIVCAGWARALHEVWGANPDAGVVTGLVLPMLTETRAQILFERGGGFRRGFLPLRSGRTQFRDPMHPCGAGKFGAGANMSVDRTLVLGLGGFDEALDTGRPLPGGGDLDIFFRVLRAGRMLVYEPRLAVRHEHRREMDALDRQYFTWGLGLMAFLDKSFRSDRAARPGLWRLAVWWWLIYMPRRLVRGDPVPASMIRSELRGAAKGMLGEYARSRRRSARVRDAAL